MHPHNRLKRSLPSNRRNTNEFKQFSLTQRLTHRSISEAQQNAKKEIYVEEEMFPYRHFMYCPEFSLMQTYLLNGIVHIDTHTLRRLSITHVHVWCERVHRFAFWNSFSNTVFVML